MEKENIKIDNIVSFIFNDFFLLGLAYLYFSNSFIFNDNSIIKVYYCFYALILLSFISIKRFIFSYETYGSVGKRKFFGYTCGFVFLFILMMFRDPFQRYFDFEYDLYNIIFLILTPFIIFFNTIVNKKTKFMEATIGSVFFVVSVMLINITISEPVYYMFIYSAVFIIVIPTSLFLSVRHYILEKNK